MVSWDAQELMRAVLSEQLLDLERRDEWVGCVEDVIAHEVANKKGLQGASIKLAYRALCKARPDAVRHALALCWVDWVGVFAPLCDNVPPGELADAFVLHREVLVDGLLQVVDRRAAKTKAPVVERLYRSLRVHAREHVGRALPSIAQAIEQRRGDR